MKKKNHYQKNSCMKVFISIMMPIIHAMYSEGAINSIVADLTSGRREGSPYDLLTGSY